MFDPNYGHYRGADGGINGIVPSQGGPPNELMEDLLWWFHFDGGVWKDAISGKSMTSVNTPTSEDGVIGNAMGLTSGAGNYVYSTDAYFKETAEGTGGSGGIPWTLTWWIYPGYGVTPWLKGDTDQWSMTKYPASGGTWYCGVKGNGGTWRNAIMDTAIADSAWHFLAYRYYGHGVEVDGSVTGAGKNGKRVNLVTGDAGSGAIAQTGTEDCCGESMQTGAGLTFGAGGTATGRIDLAARWMRLLTDSEILAVYNYTKGGLDMPFSK